MATYKVSYGYSRDKDSFDSLRKDFNTIKKNKSYKLRYKYVDNLWYISDDSACYGSLYREKNTTEITVRLFFSTYISNYGARYNKTLFNKVIKLIKYFDLFDKIKYIHNEEYAIVDIFNCESNEIKFITSLFRFCHEGGYVGFFEKTWNLIELLNKEKIRNIDYHCLFSLSRIIYNGGGSGHGIYTNGSYGATIYPYDVCMSSLKNKIFYSMNILFANGNKSNAIDDFLKGKKSTAVKKITKEQFVEKYKILIKNNYGKK